MITTTVPTGDLIKQDQSQKRNSMSWYLPETSLSQAREMRTEYKKLISRNIDASSEKKREQNKLRFEKAILSKALLKI